VSRKQASKLYISDFFLLADVAAGIGKGLMGAIGDYARGDVMGMAKGLFSTFKQATNSKGASERTIETRSSGADVIMMSGCKVSTL
jgi:hypothetical protein